MNEYKLYQVLSDACVVTEWCCLWSVFAIDADNAYASLYILVPGGGTTGTMGGKCSSTNVNIHLSVPIIL